jgi:hypothetical protein
MTEAPAWYYYGFWVFCLAALAWGASDLWDRWHK